MNTLRRSRSGFAAPQRRSMPLWLHVLAMVGVAVSVLLGLLWLLTSDRTSPLSATPNDQTLLEVIRLAFYAVAGIGGVVALTVAYRRQRISEAAENREDTKLFNERFAAAAEQLASERAANRIAGVYALAALADDWDAGRQTCVNVLCAYLRMPYEPPPSRAEREEAGEERFRTGMEERLIRHTVVNVIAERLRSRPVPGRTWHECDFNFNGATLDNCNFRGVLFKGTVSFANASFPTGAIVFSCAHFQQDANFRGATISGARVYFDRARFTGAARSGSMASRVSPGPASPERFPSQGRRSPDRISPSTVRVLRTAKWTSGRSQIGRIRRTSTSIPKGS